MMMRPLPETPSRRLARFTSRAKNGVIQNMRVRTHQADSDKAGVDARAELQRGQRRFGRQAGGQPRSDFQFLVTNLLRQIAFGSIHVWRVARQSPRARKPAHVFRLASARSKTPSRSRRCICRACRRVFLPRRRQRRDKDSPFRAFRARIHRNIFRRGGVKLLLAHKFRRALLHLISERGEAAHVGEENASPRGARRRGKVFLLEAVRSPRSAKRFLKKWI